MIKLDNNELVKINGGSVIITGTIFTVKTIGYKKILTGIASAGAAYIGSSNI